MAVMVEGNVRSVVEGACCENEDKVISAGVMGSMTLIPLGEAVRVEGNIRSVVEGACCENEDKVISAGVMGSMTLVPLGEAVRVEVVVLSTSTVESTATGMMVEVEVLGLAITVTTVATPGIVIVWFPVLQSQPSSPPQQNVPVLAVQFCIKLPPSWLPKDRLECPLW